MILKNRKKIRLIKHEEKRGTNGSQMVESTSRTWGIKGEKINTLWEGKVSEGEKWRRWRGKKEG